MSETKDPSSTALTPGPPSLAGEMDHSLEEAARQIQTDLESAARIKNDPEAALAEREKTARTSLEKARAFYKKKDYARAFAEWEKVCSGLGDQDEFKKRLRQLRSSHENLIKANEELGQIKDLMAKRSSPAAAETKFVGQAHQTVNAQVKNIYSAMSQELRTERVPKSLSFWWPLVLGVLVASGGILWTVREHSKLRTERAAVSVLAAPAPAVASPMDETYEQAQLRVLERQIEALNRDHQIALDGLKRKHAENAKGDREKVIQMETRIKELEAQNIELERRAEALFEDNVNKDRTLSNLN